MRFSGQPKGRKVIWQQPDRLLQPEHLAEILSDACRSGNRVLLPLPASIDDLRVVQVQREPFEGGVSGARLERVQVQAEVRTGRQSSEVVAFPLVFKRMAPAESWLMRASGDTRCREVQLWRSGLLDDLPQALLVPILAAAYDEQTGAGGLLMADVGRWLGRFEDCFLPVPHARWLLSLDHLARLHAHFWGDARLGEASLGLASLERALLLLSPGAIAAQRATGDAHSYLVAAWSGWQAFFDFGPPEPLRRIQRVFDHPAALLASAAAMPTTLVHGDAWPPNMGLWSGQRGAPGSRPLHKTILIDWALATAGPATFDLFWLLFYWRKVPLHRALLFYRQRLTKCLGRRGIRLSSAEWGMLVDLGVVRTVMACGETMGQAITLATHGARRAKAVALLHGWTGWAARAIQRRGWDMALE
jgi:hypothetical protein